MKQVADSYRPFAPFTAWASIPIGSVWPDFVSAFDDARAAVDEPARKRAIEIALRSAALETGAIEGLYTTNRGITQTIALQAAAWEQALHNLGEDARGHFDAQLAAFERVLDFATKAVPMSEAWIRELHATVCAAQRHYRVQTPFGPQDRPLTLGAYKDNPNNVVTADGSTHWYASVDDVPPEMHRLVEEWQSETFQNAHPVLQAAFAHHAFTAIHPFADGNGRVARALASVFLYRKPGIPLVIFSDQQIRYWDALAEADEGNVEPFVRFVEARALDTLAMTTLNLREAAAPMETILERIRGTFRVFEGVTEADVQAAGSRLLNLLGTKLLEAVRALSLPQDVQFSLGQTGLGRGEQIDGHPYATLNRGATVEGVLTSPDLNIAARITPVIGRAIDPAEPFTFILLDANRPAATAPLFLRVVDVHPSLTSAAEIQLDGWLTNAARSFMDEFAHSVEAGKAARIRQERGF